MFLTLNRNAFFNLVLIFKKRGRCCEYKISEIEEFFMEEMEAENQMMSLNASALHTPLFPAYSAQSFGSNDATNCDKTWLTNSSYTPNDQPEFFYKKEEPKAEIPKSKHKKKSKKVSREKSSIPPQEAYQVAESDSIRHHLSKKIFIEETGLSYERAYRIDPKNDPENIYYEHLEQKNIALYRVYPKLPIGCTKKEQSLYSEANTNTLKDAFPRYFSKKSVKQLKKAFCEEGLCAPQKSLSVNVTLNFIPLIANSKTVSSTQLDSKANFEGVSTSWKSEAFKFHDFKCDISDNRNEIETAADSELRSKTILFNKKLVESPHDVQMWLDFVDFQDELFNSKQPDIVSRSKTETCLIEKKIAILDKAIMHNPKSVRLHTIKLNLCQNIWQIEKVIKCWDELIFLYPNDPQMWQEYVIFVLTNLTYFSTPRVLKVYSKCLRTFSDLSEGIIKSHETPEDVVLNMLSIFSQLCFVLKSCGYTEKAVAAFQALIEFNLFSMSSVDSLPVSHQIRCFEPFWDSGAPRFGEDKAVGWATTVSEKKISYEKIVTQSDLSHEEDDILYKKLPEWKTWLEFERLREIHHWLPWRPNPEYDQTDDDIDDVERTVSFEDISKFLFLIQGADRKFLLVEHFIKFLGFNPHIFGCSVFNNKTTDTHININSFDITSSKLSDSLFKKEHSNPLCFKTAVWTKDRINFVKNVFSQAAVKFESQYKILISVMCLRCLQCICTQSNEDFVKVDDVKKFAKNMLKETENRNCLLLWFEYIKIEMLSGSKKKAKKTVETLMASSSNALADGTLAPKEVWYFIRSYIDCCLSIQKDCIFDNELFSRSEIIWLIMHIAFKGRYMAYANELITPTMILRATSGFKNLLDQELYSIGKEHSKLCYCLDPCTYSILDCAKCFAYLQYFTQGLDASIQVFKHVAELVSEKYGEENAKYILNEIHTFEAEFLNFHLWNSTASMKPLQLYLYDSIEHCPDNIKLLYFLVKLRNASSVVSPTRRFFAKILRDHHKISPVTWIFAIASELSISYSIFDQNSSDVQDNLYETAHPPSSMQWKIRSLYERALNSSICGHIPILWRSYIKFEVLNNEMERAKSIFHRAMQNCGWSKELVMDGIEYFPEDLQQNIDFMIEKQIRIETPLEEIKLLMDHGV